MGGEGDRASAQSHDSTCSIESGARNARTRDPKATSKGKVVETGLGVGPGEGVEGGDIFGEEAGGEGGVGVGVEEGAGGVEVGVVAAVRRGVGKEAAVGVEAVERGEGG